MAPAVRTHADDLIALSSEKTVDRAVSFAAGLFFLHLEQNVVRRGPLLVPAPVAMASAAASASAVAHPVVIPFAVFSLYLAQ